MTALLTLPSEVVTSFPFDRLGRLTVDQYHRMLETGVLQHGDPIELLEGVLVRKMSHNPPHDESVTLASNKLVRMLPESWRVRVQCAITLAQSEPEPDLAIVRAIKGGFRTRHPRPDDIALLIEVADSSLLSDRRYKGELYAQAGICEFWIVNVVEELVEVYTQPTREDNPRYQSRVDFAKDAAVPLTLDGTSFGSLAVADLLP